MKNLFRWIAPAAAVTVVATGALAQGGGGFQPSPQMMAKFRAWQTWRENNKNITNIQQTMFGLGELEKDPKTQLTKEQARKILAVIKKWRNKPTMTDDQAKQVMKEMTGSLTDAQLKKMATAPRFGQGGRGFGGGARPGGGGGFGGGGGGRPGGFDPSKFPDPAPYNPLNPDSSPFAKMSPEMNQRVKQRFNEFIAKLEARAK